MRAWKRLLGGAVVIISGVCIVGTNQLHAATNIHRSVGPGNTTPVATGSANALTISGTTATFASPLPNNAGKEYRSRSAFVTGEVARPGRYYLVGNQTVFDILLQAGGFTSDASGEVVVQPIDGTNIIRIDLSPIMTMREQYQTSRIPLVQGDSISVMRRLQNREIRPSP